MHQQSTVRWMPATKTAAFSALIVAALSLCVGCSGTVDDVGMTPFTTAEQAIYYGTRQPTITNLSAGEQIAVGYLADASGEPFCTATLIDRDIAVTAKHCVEGTEAVEDMRFGLGDPSSPSALVRVHSVALHESRDAGLLFLREDIVNRVPEATPLPFLREAPAQSLVNTDVEAAGFGQTDDGSTGLYFVTIELTEISDEHLVVNGWGERGICFGDSGGPLFIQLDGEPVIAGVESYGDATCVDQDFETRLDLVADWIDREMLAFDPNSAPQTGTAGSATEICIPSLGAGLDDKCEDGEMALCTTFPRRSTPGVSLLLALTCLISTRRRRP